MPEGVNAWLPMQDVKAAVELTNEIARFNQHRVTFVYDKDISDDEENCAVAPGLGWNGFTDRDRLAGRAKQELFNVVWGRSPKSASVRCTDLLFVTGGLGKFKSDEDSAIIARIALPARRSIFFVCGTPIAERILRRGEPWRAEHRGSIDCVAPIVTAP